MRAVHNTRDSAHVFSVKRSLSSVAIVAALADEMSLHAICDTFGKDLASLTYEVQLITTNCRQ